MAGDVTVTPGELRAALAVLRFALETCRGCGREGHDLPRLGLEAAEAADGNVRGAAARARHYWGELFAFEPTRPQEMPDAEPETRAATVAMTRATRLACAPWNCEPPELGHRWRTRAMLGNAADALIACGWEHGDAWREVMERFTASCPEVEL